jgi:hypothetical protein
MLTDWCVVDAKVKGVFDFIRLCCGLQASLARLAQLGLASTFSRALKVSRSPHFRLTQVVLLFRSLYY